METCGGKAVVLGLGNILLGDEGFGVYVVRRLLERYSFPPEVNLVDGGTMGFALRPYMEDASLLVIVDALSLEEDPGRIHRFELEEIRGGRMRLSLSPHQVGVIEVLDLLRLAGSYPGRVVVIGVVPGCVETGIGLSSVVEARVFEAAAMVVAELKEWEAGRA